MSPVYRGEAKEMDSPGKAKQNLSLTVSAAKTTATQKQKTPDESIRRLYWQTSPC